MAKPTPAQKLGNLTTQANAPVPRILVPPFPPRLAKIDPDGAAQFAGDLQRALDDHVNKLNVLQGNVVTQIVGT